MKFKYEDLEIWQLSLELIEAIYKLLKKFSAEEKYDLVSQGKRAVVSIALNIAEGSGRHTDRDFCLFINRAITSLQEVDGVLKIAMKLKYISNGEYQSLSPLIEKEYYKLVAFDKSLIKGSKKRKRYNQ
jgi:four helix bundle protein